MYFEKGNDKLNTASNKNKNITAQNKISKAYC